MEMRIEIVKNGFIVAIGSGEMGVKGESYAFNSAVYLGAFITQWGIDNKTWTNTVIEKDVRWTSEIIDGVEYMKEVTEEASEDDEWISIAEGMPFDGQRISTKAKGVDNFTFVYNDTHGLFSNVTHWKPA